MFLGSILFHFHLFADVSEYAKHFEFVWSLQDDMQSSAYPQERQTHNFPYSTKAFNFKTRTAYWIIILSGEQVSIIINIIT